MQEDLQKLANAINSLNKPFAAEITAADTVTVYWRWKDAVAFGIPPTSVTKEVQEFKYFITLLPNNKYKTSSNSKSSNISFSGGKLSFGASNFSGQQVGMHKEIDLFSKDNQTGNVGVNVFEFKTSEISEPVKQILANMGYKKKGLFG